MNEKIANLKQRQIDALYKTFNERTSSKIAIKTVQTGREQYVTKFNELLGNIKINNTGTTKFIIADYGVGKTFLIEMLVEQAKADKFMVSKVDLSPERLLYHEKKAIQTYSLIMSNLTCKGSSNALENIFQTVAAQALKMTDDHQLTTIETQLRKNLQELKAYPDGNDVINVVCKYNQAYLEDDEMTMSCCMKWIRGEYENKALLKKELGIDKLITSSNYKHFIVLINRLGKLCGYHGLVVLIDECVNIKDAYHTTRKKNYETILNIYNETTQNEIKDCIFMFAGDVEFLTNPHKGLYSYDALRQRLENEDLDYIDLDSPVWRLKYLKRADQLALVSLILEVFSRKFAIDFQVDMVHLQNYVDELNQGMKNENVVTREIISTFTQRLNKIKNGDGTAEELFTSQEQVDMTTATNDFGLDDAF